MQPREDRIQYLASQLANDVAVGRSEGMTEIEIGAAIGLLMAQLVPAAEDRKNIMAFADRHATPKR